MWRFVVSLTLSNVRFRGLYSMANVYVGGLDSAPVCLLRTLVASWSTLRGHSNMVSDVLLYECLLFFTPTSFHHAP